VLRIRIRIRIHRIHMFWASRIRIHWSEVWIRILLWIRIRILLSSCKNSQKNLDSYYFVTLFDFLSRLRKNCVKKLVFGWYLEGQ
jgi:hypothetical protein